MKQICVLLLAFTAILYSFTENGTRVPSNSVVSESLNLASDLDSLEFLEFSDKYEVRVNNETVPVYRSRSNAHKIAPGWKFGPHKTNGIEKMSFVGFDLPPETNEDGLSITITLLDDSNFYNYEIRPWSSAVNTVVSSKTIEFEINKPLKLLITTNDEFEDVLVLTANPYHTPPAPSPNIIYFESDSIYMDVERYKLKDGDTVYIAENSIVQGGFDLENTNNVTIYGRGIVYNGDEIHDEDYSVFFADYANDFSIEGITITNSPGWNIRSYVGNNVTIRNIKEIGQWLYNTDGVQTGVNGLLVEDCFLQTNDDCFTLNGNAQNIEIRNNIGWNLFNGSHVMLGWNSAHVKNAHVHDNIVLRNGDCCINSPNKISGPLTMRLKALTNKWGANYYENVLIENITVEEIVNKGVWLSMRVDTLAPPLSIKNVKYKNINIIKADTVWGDIRGDSFYNRPIHNITFENVRVNGKCITSAEAGNLTLEHTENIKFNTVDTTVTTNGSTVLISNTENAAYQWLDCANGNTPIVGATNRSFNPTRLGSYAVRVTKNGCTGISSCYVGNPNQPPEAVISAYPSSGQAPLEVHFSGEGSTDDVGITDYLWNFKDSTNTSSLPDPFHTFTEPGIYTVELTVFDTEGLTGTTTVIIRVDKPVNKPPIAIALANPNSGEAPLEVAFMGSGSTDDTGIISYAWDFKDGSTSTEMDPVHIFSKPGTYSVELIVTDDMNQIDSNIVNIIVKALNQPPVAIIAATPNQGTVPLEVLFTGSESTDDGVIVNYAWDFKDGNSSTEASPSHTFDMEGIYLVELTVTDDKGLVGTVEVVIIANEASDNPGTVILENPMKGNVAKIRILNKSSGMVLKNVYLHDSLGRFISTFNPQETLLNDTYHIPMPILQNGMYLLELEIIGIDPVRLKLMVNN